LRDDLARKKLKLLDTVRVGVIGTGALGRHHARLYGMCPTARLVGVYDVDPSAARGVAEQTGCRAFDSVDALAAEVDALSIVVPAHLHHAVAMPLLAQGKHLLVEKPLAATLPEAEEMVSAAAAAGVVLAVGHVERFSPALAAIEALPGPIRYLSARRDCPYPPPRPGLVARGCEVSVAHDLMIHDIDLCLSLFGDMPVSVAAYGQTALSDSPDFLAARLCFADGRIADLAASRVAPGPTRELLVVKDGGHVVIDLRTRTAVVRRFAGERVSTEAVDIPAGNPLADELADFCHAIRNVSSPRSAGKEALQALSVVEKVVTCATQGK
jgi:predicted dehydrogenase